MVPLALRSRGSGGVIGSSNRLRTTRARLISPKPSNTRLEGAEMRSGTLNSILESREITNAFTVKSRAFTAECGVVRADAGETVKIGKAKKKQPRKKTTRPARRSTWVSMAFPKFPPNQWSNPVATIRDVIAAVNASASMSRGVSRGKRQKRSSKNVKKVLRRIFVRRRGSRFSPVAFTKKCVGAESREPRRNIRKIERHNGLGSF